MTHPVIVVGAGPVGLAAAAHLLEAGIEPLVLEAGPEAGHSIRDWAHVGLFTDWQLVIDPASARLLEASGWRIPPPKEYPSGGDLVEKYLKPLAAALGNRIQVDHRVTAVSRQNVDKVVTDGREQIPFLVRAETDKGPVEFLAESVIDASGTWLTPNPVGSSGLPAIGEDTTQNIRYGIPDVLGRERDRYQGKRVLVVGAGHSAANVLLDLAELALEDPATVPVWAIRRPDPSKAYGAMEEDELPARGKVGMELRHRVEASRIELEADFQVRRIEDSGGKVGVTGSASDGSQRTLTVDEIVVATGQRPDLAMTRELRLELDPWLEAPAALAPLIDPNVHTCLTVPPHGVKQLSHPDPGFYTVGIKSYGRAPTFLMATGYEQVRSVAAAIAGDWEAATQTDLELR